METLTQNDLDAVSDVEECIEDYDPQFLGTSEEAKEMINRFEIIWEKYKTCHSVHKVAMGSEYW